MIVIFPKLVNVLNKVHTYHTSMQHDHCTLQNMNNDEKYGNCALSLTLRSR